MFIKIEDKNIHYQFINQQWIDEGRDVLIFLHEGLGSIPQWKNFPQQLSESMQMPALVYERVGYGESDFWNDREIKSQYIHDEANVILPSLVKQLKIDNNIILFGHSDGGTLALIHAANPMPNIKAAIVEAPHVFLEQYSLIGIRKARAILKNEKIIRIMDRYHQNRAAELIDKWSSFWLNSKETDWEASDSLKKITIPLLLIQGDNDDFGTFAQIERVAELAKSNIIEVAKIDNCGHIPHLEKQEEIMKLSHDFINKL